MDHKYECVCFSYTNKDADADKNSYPNEDSYTNKDADAQSYKYTQTHQYTESNGDAATGIYPATDIYGASYHHSDTNQDAHARGIMWQVLRH